MLRLFASVLLLAACLLFPLGSAAGELPTFATDEEADAWLRTHSPFYATMVADVESRGSYRFTVQRETPKAGDVHFENGQRFIALGAELAGPHRLSVLIFEMTNAYQEKAHQVVDERARDGTIADPIHFGLLHELIEYDGLRYHRRVLAELDPVVGGIPKPMLTWVNPDPTTIASYELPLAFAFVEAQAKSGHTSHYHRWFFKQRDGEK